MNIAIKPSPLEAWTILRAQSLGQIDGVDPAERYDADVLEQYNEKFSMHILTIMNNAGEELQSLLKGTQFDTELPLDITLPVVREFLDLIEGSDFEQLHLTAFLRINNLDLLWERVKP
jgi:hypothetical protein